MPTHALLVPTKCTRDNPPEAWLRDLVNGIGTGEHQLRVYIGIDADDTLWTNEWAESAASLLNPLDVTVDVVISPPDQPSGAVSAVWNRLAKRAVADGVDGWLVLGGDDVVYSCNEGGAWLEDAWRDNMDGREKLRLLHPMDATDPSCCTFPIVAAQHVDLLGSVVSFQMSFSTTGPTHFSGQCIGASAAS